MAKTTQKSAIDDLLATGKYETYTNASGETDVRLKQENQTGEGTASTPNTSGSGMSAYDYVFGGQKPNLNATPQTVDSAGGFFGTPTYNTNYNPYTQTNTPSQVNFDTQDYIRQLVEAKPSRAEPFEHPDLVKDDLDDEEIL